MKNEIKPAAHTPTPWKFHTDRYNNHMAIIPPHNNVHGQFTSVALHTGYNEEAKANAALIVRAVNSHEELVSVCADFCKGCENGEQVGEKFFSALLDRARAALAKAKGQQ